MKNPQETDAFVPGGGQRSLQVDNASISSEATHDAGKARTMETHQSQLEPMKTN